MKKIAPCTILQKFGQNAYEITLPPTHLISPIFNVSDLTPFKENIDRVGASTDVVEIHGDWVKNLPPSQPLQLERILKSKILKETRNHTYLQYLVKWKNLLDIDTTWMIEQDIFFSMGTPWNS